MDVQALGTSLNMENKTPGKSMPPPLNRQHVSRCCNFSFVSNPIVLFGPKSESKNLLSIIVKVTGLSVSESDGLPTVGKFVVIKNI